MKTATAIALSLALTTAFATSAFAKKPGFEMPKKCYKQECHTVMGTCHKTFHHGGHPVEKIYPCPKQVCKTVEYNCPGNL